MSRLTPEVHRRFHRSPPVVRYRPDTVRNILEGIWKTTNVAIDLAFYAYFARDYELAMKILDLDRLVSESVGHFVMHNAMAFGKSKKGGYASLLSFYYGSSVDTISDSVKDIVYTLLVGRSPGISYNQVIHYADGEVVVRLPAKEDFKVLDLTDRYPVDVLAVVESGEYKFMPKQTEVVKRGSLMYLRGFKENVLHLLDDYGVEYSLEVIGIRELEDVVKSLVNIKDCTVLMLDLAHYVLVEHTPELKEEINDLEIYIDWKHMETMDLLKSIAGSIDPDTFIGLVTLLKELEDIADASTTIGSIPSLQEEFPKDYRELFSNVFESLGERVRTVTITKQLNISELGQHLRKYGGGVLAVRSGNAWIAYPLARGTTLNPGDKAIITYQEEFSDEVDSILKQII
ncbi:MAG: hypothetical protein QXZ22_07730 [Sulfolobales archaeon]